MTTVPGDFSAGKRFRSSFTEGKFYAARIFLGRVVNFNLETYAVDVHLDNADSDIEDTQVSMPYFHWSNGEGMYMVPEVGCQCIVVYPSDGSYPYVAGFLGVVEETSGTEEDESQTAGGEHTGGATPTELEDAGAEDEESGAASASAAISYRNGRPLLRPGDGVWRTRDGNGIVLRRGGVVQIGVNGICQRLYIPINNLIQDFAQNYNLSTPGANFNVELLEQDEDNTRVDFTIVAREFAEDAQAAVALRMGELNDNYFELNVCRQGIDYKRGTVIDESDLSLLISKDGDWYLTANSQTIEVEERSIVVEGKNTEEYGSMEQTVEGEREISFKSETKRGESSDEKGLKRKTIEAKEVVLGQGVAGKLVRADKLIPFFNAHTHTVTGPATGPPILQLTEALIACLTVKGA